jgi:hypothetical protein
MTYQEINPDIWTYENDGDLVEGVLVNTSQCYTPSKMPRA